MELLTQTTDYLNANPGVIAGLAALVGILVQYGIKRYTELGKFVNYFLALVALPGLTTAVAAYTTELHLTAYPAVALLGQLGYALYEQLKANAVKTAVTQQNF